jgi:hypothetical protein
VPLVSLVSAPPSPVALVPASLLALGITQPEREDALERNRPLKDNPIAERQMLFIAATLLPITQRRQIFGVVFGLSRGRM